MYTLSCCSFTSIHYSGGFCCVQLERNGGEQENYTIANHFKNPMILFQHMLTLFSSIQNCLQNVGQLQQQFAHLENGISQHTVHPGQLAKSMQRCSVQQKIYWIEWHYWKKNKVGEEHSQQ